MGFLEDIFIKAKSAANNLGTKAGKTVDVCKLNVELAEVKAQLKSKFENIGKAVYSSMKSGENIVESKSLESEITEIDKLYCRVETLKKEIAVLKDKTICKACGSPNSSEDLYCGKCGHTLEIRCTCKSESNNEEKNAQSEECECVNSSDDCSCYSDCSCRFNSSDEND